MRIEFEIDGILNKEIIKNTMNSDLFTCSKLRTTVKTSDGLYLLYKVKRCRNKLKKVKISINNNIPTIVSKQGFVLGKIRNPRKYRDVYIFPLYINEEHAKLVTRNMDRLISLAYYGTTDKRERFKPNGDKSEMIIELTQFILNDIIELVLRLSKDIVREFMNGDSFNQSNNDINNILIPSLSKKLNALITVYYQIQRSFNYLVTTKYFELNSVMEEYFSIIEYEQDIELLYYGHLIMYGGEHAKERYIEQISTVYTKEIDMSDQTLMLDDIIIARLLTILTDDSHVKCEIIDLYNGMIPDDIIISISKDILVMIIHYIITNDMGGDYEPEWLSKFLETTAPVSPSIKRVRWTETVIPVTDQFEWTYPDAVPNDEFDILRYSIIEDYDVRVIVSMLQLFDVAKNEHTIKNMYHDRYSGYPRETSQYSGYPRETSQYSWYPRETSQYSGYPSDTSQYTDPYIMDNYDMDHYGMDRYEMSSMEPENYYSDIEVSIENECHTENMQNDIDIHVRSQYIDERHIQLLHRGIPNNMFRLTCGFCERRFGSRNELFVHLKKYNVNTNKNEKILEDRFIKCFEPECEYGADCIDHYLMYNNESSDSIL